MLNTTPTLPLPLPLWCCYSIFIHACSLLWSLSIYFHIVCTYLYRFLYRYPHMLVCVCVFRPNFHPFTCIWTTSSLSNSSVASSKPAQSLNSKTTTPAATNGGESPQSPLNVAPIRSSLFPDSNINGSSASLSSKPVPNHGKPNCAPKPPNFQQNVVVSNGPKTSTNGGCVPTAGKPTVSRHHSMKTPRYVLMQKQ